MSSTSARSGAPTGTGFTAIFSTSYAFAALHESGTIHAWGPAEDGGSGAPTGSGFVTIFSTASSFAALDESGGIHVWGRKRSGGSHTSGREYGHSYTGAPSGTGFNDIATTT